MVENILPAIYFSSPEPLAQGVSLRLDLVQHAPPDVCVCVCVCGGGTQIFSYIHRLGSFLCVCVQNFEFQYFWGGFKKNEYFLGGIKIL